VSEFSTATPVIDIYLEAAQLPIVLLWQLTEARERVPTDRKCTTSIGSRMPACRTCFRLSDTRYCYCVPAFLAGTPH